MPHGDTATLTCAVLHAQTVPDVYMPHGDTVTLKCAVLHAQTVPDNVVKQWSKQQITKFQKT